MLRVTCCGTRPPERRKATVATTPTGRPHTGPPMCAGIRGSHRACEGLPPGVVKSVKTKKPKGRVGGKQNSTIQARYPVEASRARKPCAAYRGSAGGGSHGSPASTPDAGRRPLGFRADLQQPGRRNPPPRKYLGCQGIENPGFPSPDPRGLFPRWKNGMRRFTQRKPNPLSFSIPPRHARRPSTSETP